MVLVPGRKKISESNHDARTPPLAAVHVVERWKETIRHALRSGHIANNVEARSMQDQARSSKIKQDQAISIVSVSGFLL